MANIIRNKSFWIGFIFGILFTFAGLFVAYKIDSKRTEIIEVLDVVKKPMHQFNKTKSQIASKFRKKK